MTLAAATAAAVPAVAADDGRAFELLSGGLESGRNVKQAPPVVDPSGDRVVFDIDAAQADSGGARERIYRLASRSSAGWTSKDVNPTSAANASFYDDFNAASPDAGRLLIEGGRLEPGVARSGVFAVDTASRAATRVATGDFAASSRSTDVVYFGSTENLAPGAERFPDDDVTRLYRVDATGIHFASDVPSAGFTDSFRTPLNALREGYLYGPGSRYDFLFDPTGSLDYAAQDAMPIAGGRRHVVSVDGARLFFAAGAEDTLVPDEFNPDPAFAHQPRTPNGLTVLPLWLADGDSGAVLISASRRTGQGRPARIAQFVGASPDGGTAYFVSGAPLQDGETGSGIYRYELATDDLTRLTPDIPSTASEIEGLVELGLSSAVTSDDASTLYFVASSKLDDDATPGTRNAYAWHDGRLTFIADLGTDGKIERASRDGRFAVFSSSRATEAAPTGGSVQLFRYDRVADRLLCASCRSDGTANAGGAAVNLRLAVAGTDRVSDLTTPRNVADDGSVFFTSRDRLVAEDQSARPDVYEFTGDAVRLLSNGEGASTLVDNTDDGRSVFMVSTAALVPADDDAGNFDLYVRRTDGGFPDAPAAARPCSGDGCQGPPGVPPATVTPASDRPGPGNVPPATDPAILSAPRIAASDRRALGRGARGAVAVRLRGPGRLSIGVRGRAGGGRRLLAASATRVASDRAQTKRVRLRLGRAARRQLRRRGTLRITITASLAGAGSRSTTLTLRQEGR